MATNSLSFVVDSLNPPEQIVRSATPVIDGRPLMHLVTEFETQRAMIPLVGTAESCLTSSSLAPVDNYSGKADETFVLGCDCGVGCWPVESGLKAFTHRGGEGKGLTKASASLFKSSEGGRSTWLPMMRLLHFGEWRMNA
jgi:hypothetical protein